MSRVHTTWNGDKLKKRARNASEEATEQTLAAAVERARGLAPVRTGQYRDSIAVTGVDVEEDGTSGGFGATAPHAFFVEVGARGNPGQHVLRRAADAEFAQHADRVRRAF